MAHVYNHDIVGLYSRLNRFIEEMQYSVSSSVSTTNDFDATRLETYLDAIDTYHAWVINQPDLDLPETHPREYELEDGPVIVDSENESVNDIVRILRVARDELVNSQSARLGAKLTTHDSTRLTAVVAKVRAFLNDYIRQATPLDLPESSPREVITAPGRKGVNPS